MHVLITGGTGFVGSHLVEYILKHTNYQITVLDRLDFSSTLQRLAHLSSDEFKDRLQFVHHDLKAPLINELLINKINKFDLPDIIYHLAASSHVDRSIENPMSFVMDNVVGTVNILDYFRTDAKYKSKFFYFSTDEIFGTAPDEYDFKENDPYNSQNPYAASKAGAEEMCLAYQNTYDLDIVITHCMNIFGERQHREKFIPKCISYILEGKEIPIHANKECTKAGTRFYIHAERVAEALLFLSSNGNSGEKYNIVGQKELNNLELVHHIANILGQVANYKLVDFHSSRPGHDLRYGLDGTKLKEMGFQFTNDIFADLETTVNWFLDNKEWL